MIVNREGMGILTTAYSAAFKDGLGRYTSQWDKIATRVPSKTRKNKYGWLGQFPRMEVWAGGRTYKAMSEYDYELVNEKFQAAIKVQRDDIEDDQYGVLSPLFEEMGYAAAVFPEELLFPLLLAGFSNKCYDGQNFFDADHPMGSTTFANMQSGSSSPFYLFDTRRPLKALLFQDRRAFEFRALMNLEDFHTFDTDEFPFGVDGRCVGGYGLWQLAFGSQAGLTQNNFDAAYAAMMKVESDKNRKLGVKPTLLVTGPTNRAAALEVIEVERLANGASNPDYKCVDLLISPWLD